MNILEEDPQQLENDCDEVAEAVLELEEVADQNTEIAQSVQKVAEALIAYPQPAKFKETVININVAFNINININVLRN